MSGDIEYGKCEMCGNSAPLQRTYFRYDIRCGCHSPHHFNLVIHCEDCKPKEPLVTRYTHPEKGHVIEVETKDLPKLKDER